MAQRGCCCFGSTSTEGCCCSGQSAPPTGQCYRRKRTRVDDAQRSKFFWTIRDKPASKEEVKADVVRVARLTRRARKEGNTNRWTGRTFPNNQGFPPFQAGLVQVRAELRSACEYMHELRMSGGKMDGKGGKIPGYNEEALLDQARRVQAVADGRASVDAYPGYGFRGEAISVSSQSHPGCQTPAPQGVLGWNFYYLMNAIAKKPKPGPDEEREERISSVEA
jgi:hypothetical protein